MFAAPVSLLGWVAGAGVLGGAEIFAAFCRTYAPAEPAVPVAPGVALGAPAFF
jgi:hypothetical protein